MKLLIVPKPDVTFHDAFIDAAFFPKFNLSKIKGYIKFNQVSYEYNYYSDIVSVNKGVTHILGRLHRQYRIAPPADCTNPSARLCPNVLPVRASEAFLNAASYDAILCSSWSFGLVSDLLIRARRAGVLVAMIDHADHEEIFLSRDQLELTRGLREGIDFDLYFKKDLPIGMGSDRILPLGPDPVRPISYGRPKIIPQSERQTTVFFSGILNKPTTKSQRDGLLQAVQNSVKGSYINIVDVDDHYKKKNLFSNLEISNYMSNSRVVLCAPGRAWTTTRLSCSAIFGCVPMVAQPDCELVDSELITNNKALVYPNLRYLQGSKRQDAISEALELLQSIIHDSHRLELMAKAWKKNILSKHTTEARARYILQSISKTRDKNEDILS